MSQEALEATPENAGAALTDADASPVDADRWLGYPKPDKAQLVSISNRDAFDRDLSAGYEAATSEEPLSLLMIDIDHFKRVNDEHGHPGGDVVLIGVSDRVRKTVGRRGRAYRYGGEEIAVLLPHFTVEEAFHVAERIRRAVALDTWTHSGPEIRVTISVGAAASPHEGMGSQAALLEAADKALYKAKKSGRNRTCFAEGMDPEVNRPALPAASDGDQCPDLCGTWKGVLRSEWRDPTTKLKQEQRDVFMIVRKTDAALHMGLITSESRSLSLAITVVQEPSGEWSLNVIYRNEPRPSVRSRSQIHHGAMVLQVGGSPVITLSGHYWTDRGTQGEITLRFVSRELASDYATALALAAPSGAASASEHGAPKERS
jgi:diguanylate cyclase (GGDEF)-like protein